MTRIRNVTVQNVIPLIMNIGAYTIDFLGRLKDLSLLLYKMTLEPKV